MMSSATSSSTSNVVGVHYRVGKKIGEGSFGVLFEGTNLLTNQLVAIKFEPRKSEAPQLRDEYRTYKILVGCPGVPNVYYFGQEGLHNILVIDLLGPSLEDLFDHCNRRFSVKTSVLLAKQMISRVQTIHEKNMIYRDIKPDNFLMGRPGTRAANVVHVVDFGMAKQYRDPKTKQHMPYRERKALSGTARYMSINTHNGREQSRRDDLEALGHVFIYFLRGGLPWQGLKANSNKQKYDKIGEKKAQVAPKDLCEGLPDEFRKYLEYTRGLGFEETPDYDYCRSLMSKALADAGEVEDGEYDWLSHPKPGSARNAQRQGSGQKLREFKEVGNDRLMADLPTPKGKNDVYPPGPAKNINPPRRDTKARGPELQGSNAMRYPDATRKRYGQENEVDGSALATYGSATQGQSTMPTAYQPNSRNTQPGATQNETSQNMADMRESPTKKDSKFKKFINGMCCGMMD